MVVNSKLMLLHAERFYDWSVASLANFCKGVATKKNAPYHCNAPR